MSNDFPVNQIQSTKEVEDDPKNLSEQRNKAVTKMGKPWERVQREARALTFEVLDAVGTIKASDYGSPTWHAYPRPCGRHLKAPGGSESKDKALGMQTHRFLENLTQSVPWKRVAHQRKRS